MNRQLSLVLVGLSLIACSQTANAVDDWNVDGEHGELDIHGLLLEGACRLDMTSAFQDISLGNLSRADFLTPGNEGEPVNFTIKLRDCSRSGGDQTDRYTGTSAQDAIQPVVTFSFLGVADPDMPGLLKTTGVTGLALKLKDPQGREVRLGERGEPLFITPGDNTLTWTVTPVRTPAEITTGNFHAVTHFEVSYD